MSTKLTAKEIQKKRKQLALVYNKYIKEMKQLNQEQMRLIHQFVSELEKEKLNKLRKNLI